VKIIATAVAFSTLGAFLAAPAGAQPAQASPKAPILAPGFSGAFDDAKRKCHEFAQPYKGSMLEGKISVDDEDTSAAMMANESYPTAQEAVVLRGFIAAFEKCEAVQLAFIKQYAAWDLPNVQYILDTQKPVYLALMARQITYGMANRNINHVQEEVLARRKAMQPKEMLDRKALDAEFRSALTAVVAKCNAQYAPLKSGILKNRIAFDRDETSTPQMQADKSMPSSGEAVELRKLVTATRQCGEVYKEFVRTYAPQYVPVTEREQELRMAVYLALADQRISYGEANRKLEETKPEIATMQKTAAADYRSRREAEKAADAAKTGAAPPQQVAQGGAVADAAAVRAANDLMKTRCDVLYAPIRGGVLKSKIALDRENSTTPEMLMDRSRPNAAEIAALKSLLEARDQCNVYVRDYARLTVPQLLPEIDRQHRENGALVAGLIARKFTFGEANQKAYELEAQWKQAVENLKAQQNPPRPQASAGAASQGQQGAAKVPTAIDAAYQEMNQKCNAAVDPFRTGSLSSKIPMGYHISIAAMQDNDALPTDAEAAAVKGYLSARQLCAAYMSRYAKGFMPWMQAPIDHQFDGETQILTALAAKQMRFGEAARKLHDIELQSDAEAEAAVAARKTGVQNGAQSNAPLQGAFQALQPDGVLGR